MAEKSKGNDKKYQRKAASIMAKSASGINNENGRRSVVIVSIMAAAQQEQASILNGRASASVMVAAISMAGGRQWRKWQQWRNNRRVSRHGISVSKQHHQAMNNQAMA